jgi:hypothetical protein
LFGSLEGNGERTLKIKEGVKGKGRVNNLATLHEILLFFTGQKSFHMGNSKNVLGENFGGFWRILNKFSNLLLLFIILSKYKIISHKYFPPTPFKNTLPEKLRDSPTLPFTPSLEVPLSSILPFPPNSQTP